ncbi:MAG: leucine-rich repeat protein [Acutalibacteraceae bacterium]
MKKFLSLVLSVVMALTTFSVVGFAVEEPFASGVVGTAEGGNFYWELSEDGGILTVTGEGKMPEFEESPQWLSYNFTRLVIGEGILGISTEAFSNAANLEGVEFSSTVESIGQRVFYGCENLKEVRFPDSVAFIGSMAFYGCTALKEIRIPETVKEIENYALGYYCNEELDDEFAKIEDVTVFAKADTAAQKYAEANEISFINLSDYTEFFEYEIVEDSENETRSITLVSYKDCPYSEEIIIPEEIEGVKVTDLGGFLFEGSDVKSVYIPASVKNISTTAFENADELTEIICEDGGKYGSLDGVLYEDDFSNLVKVPEGKEEISKFPENLKTVGEFAFKNSKVESIELPESVGSLEENAFAFSNLEEVVLPEGLREIPKMCFFGSARLTKVVIPETVKSIGANAFGNCTALEDVYLPYGIESIDGAAFHCTALKSAVIPDSVNNIGDYAFGYYSAEDIEFVKNSAFEIKGRNGTAAEEYAVSNELSFTEVAPKQPAIWYAYTDKISANVFWENVEGAEYYEIYRKTDNGDFEKIAEVGCDEDTVFCDATVENGKTYTYCVVSVKGNVKSSSEKSVDIEFIKISTPALVSAKMTQKGIYVAWKTVGDADGYILYRKTDSTQWSEIADFKGGVTAFEDTTCKSGETYYYTVKAYSGTVESGCDYDGVSAMYLSIPKLKKAENTSSGIKITWEKVAGANGYIIGRKSGSGSWTKIAQTKDVNTYTDKTAKAGTTYTYTVVPVCDNVKGFYNEEGITYRRLSNVTTESIANTADGIKLTWKPVSNCTGYKVYRKTENGAYTKIATLKGADISTYTDKKVTSGVKYYYKVVAYSGSYVSSYNEVSRYYIDNPTLSSASSGKSGVTVKWSTVTGASGYYVYRKTGDGSYTKIATVNGQTKKSYLDKSAKKGKTYTYKVKAYYGKTTSAYSNTKSVTDKY